MNEQTIIILCGPDMCGKTNIGKELSHQFNVPYFKAKNEHETYLKQKDYFLQQLLHADPRVVDLLTQTGQSLIMDRGYPCEYVYSKVMGRKTDFQMIEKLDEAFAAINTWIIVCHRSSYNGIVDDIDSNINEAMLNKIDNEYKSFMKLTKCKKMLLNVDDENLEREVNDILFMLGKGTYKKR